MGKEGPDAESGMPAMRWRSIAERFVTARQDARALDAYPGAVPQSLDEAYAIQTQAIALHGGTVGGWKIGRINPPGDTHWQANRLAGPIFTDQIVEAPAGTLVGMPVITAGFAAAEAEFLVRIGAAAEPGKEEWSLAEVRALADRVAIGIEIASSPLPAINDLGAAVTASDFGNNYGLLVGPDRKKRQVEESAQLLFHQQGVSQTRGRTGIVVLISQTERCVAVIADSGVRRAVDSDQWEELLQSLHSLALSNDLAGAAAMAVEQLGEFLAEPLPVADDDIDELSNVPHLH